MILPLYNSLAPLTLNRVFAAAPSYDPDAQAYIDAVEFEDGQALEVAVKDAINDFVVGCKSDGIWTSIKAACILAGARTLDGALVPLVGSAPTNNNFVSGDYDRETGLVGNGSTKYLDSNRNNNADPQDDNHNAIYIHTAQTAGTPGTYIGAGASDAGTNNIYRGTISTLLGVRQRSSTSPTFLNYGDSTGLVGTSRSNSANINVRAKATNLSTTLGSQTPYNANIYVFRRNAASASFTAARLSFYSIGESIDLADLDSRVSTLMTDIAAAIP